MDSKSKTLPPPSKARSNSIHSISTDGAVDHSSGHVPRAKSSKPKHGWEYVPVDPAEDQAPPPNASRLEKELHSSFTNNFLTSASRRTRASAASNGVNLSYNTTSEASTAASSNTDESTYSSKSSNTAVSPASSPAPPAGINRKRKDSAAVSGDASHVPKKVKTASAGTTSAPVFASPPPPPPKPAEEKPHTRFPGLFPHGLPPISVENRSQPKSPGLVSPGTIPENSSSSSSSSSTQQQPPQPETSKPVLASADYTQKRKRSASPSSPATMPKKKKTWTKKATTSPAQQQSPAHTPAAQHNHSKIRAPTDQEFSEQLEEIMLGGLRAGPGGYASMRQYRAACAAEAAWQEGDRVAMERMLCNPQVREKLMRLRQLSEEIEADRKGGSGGKGMGAGAGDAEKKKRNKNPANKGIGRGNWKRKPKMSDEMVGDESEDEE